MDGAISKCHFISLKLSIQVLTSSSCDSHSRSRLGNLSWSQAEASSVSLNTIPFSSAQRVPRVSTIRPGTSVTCTHVHCICWTTANHCKRAGFSFVWVQRTASVAAESSCASGQASLFEKFGKVQTWETPCFAFSTTGCCPICKWEVLIAKWDRK